jgi:hypothetical protein
VQALHKVELEHVWHPVEHTTGVYTTDPDADADDDADDDAADDDDDDDDDAEDDDDDDDPEDDDADDDADDDDPEPGSTLLISWGAGGGGAYIKML